MSDQWMWAESREFAIPSFEMPSILFRGCESPSSPYNALLFNRDEGNKWRKKSFHWFWALSKTIPICHTCCHYGRRCQSVKHFSMVVDIVDTIWKRSQTGAFCFLYASIPSKDLFDAILLYCYTIDCFWWVWGSWWFMHQKLWDGLT